MPSSGPGTEGAVDRKAKPRERQNCSEGSQEGSHQLEEGSSLSGSQEGSHQLGDVGPKSDPCIAKTSPDTGSFLP